MMRKPLSCSLFSLAVIAVLAVIPACSSSESPETTSKDPGTAAASGTAPGGTTAKINTKLLKFEPQKLTVKKGTTVVWEVPDSLVHNVTTGKITIGGNGLRTAENPDGTIDKPLKKGQTVSFTFDKPGTYTYYCSIHKGMNGEIVVTA